MPNHIKKYYTYHDEFPEQTITKDFCIVTIKQIVLTYTKEAIFRAMSYYAQSIGLGNDFEQILTHQRRIFKIPPTRDPIIIHRQAICVIFQFLFSFGDEEFGLNTEVTNIDVFFLFILSNQLTDFIESETLDIKKSTHKRNFFTNIKEIHYTNNKDDLQASFYLFKKYYRRIVELNNDVYENVIQEYFGFTIEDYVTKLELIEQRNYPEIFALFDKYAVLNFNETKSAWDERNPKFIIPREFSFIQKYPLIKINEQYLVTDLHSVFSSITKSLYRTLLEFDNISFKGDFGKQVIEPTIIELISETFIDESVKSLKVGTKKREYGDFGLLHNDCIYLFEIKSSLLNEASIYTDNYNAFMKIFNDKFVKKEGIRQQIKKIQLIEDNYEHFCSLSQISPNKKYKIYPVLVSFDETLMSFFCNWYLSMRFNVFKRICKLNYSKFDLANGHSTITCNEVYRLRYVDKQPSERLKLLKNYSDDSDKIPVSFSFYLQELSAFTIAR